MATSNGGDIGITAARAGAGARHSRHSCLRHRACRAWLRGCASNSAAAPPRHRWRFHFAAGIFTAGGNALLLTGAATDSASRLPALPRWRALNLSLFNAERDVCHLSCGCACFFGSAAVLYRRRLYGIHAKTAKLSTNKGS